MLVPRLLFVGVTVIFLDGTLCRACTQSLAKGKPAYQSSTLYSKYPASNAVDAERLNNFEVRVGTTYVDNSSFTQYKLCASYPGVAPVGNTCLSCGSPLRGRYVLIIKVGSDDSYLQLCEVEVHDGALCRGCTQNLAKGKPAYQSSTIILELVRLAASLAVDGNYDDSMYHLSCTHTDLGQGQWWLVDLLRTERVAGVIITNRGDCCSDRLNNFEVRVGTTYVDNSSFTQYKLCASYPGVAPVGNMSLSCVTTSTTFKRVAAGARATLVPMSTLNVGSRTECSISCLQNWKCVAINVLCAGNDQCVCELLPSTAQSGDLQADTGYDYYEDNCLETV
ncbi:uncharacterized protein LOC106177244 [Lingula anatina]|uniref:Uncharacterized protein LOC106177244 n=1 Tax=Lingula anatina TaxID=7574 RepID=A0A1S3JZA1_LINAN|nr:uncharacterized protein LOC106177244 [Lingula anatina]|eukprot:XP_013415419.1 uncharacterized protein LOC106177244 [Lingula anatina]